MCSLYSSKIRDKRGNGESILDPQKESGEDFARRILEILKKAREEKLGNKEEEVNNTKGDGSARVLHPARREEETKKNEKGD